MPTVSAPPPPHRERKLQVGYRLPRVLIEALDSYSEDHEVSRNAALEHLLTWALTHAGHAPKAA